MVNAADMVLDGYARLNITYNGQNGDLPDPVLFDAADGDIKQWAAEALTAGIPGIDPVANPDLTNFMVDRFPAHGDVPYPRIVVRPKTPFGAAR